MALRLRRSTRTSYLNTLLRFSRPSARRLRRNSHAAGGSFCAGSLAGVARRHGGSSMGQGEHPSVRGRCEKRYSFDESAGGATVAYLMTSPLAENLFSKAINQSGALALPELDLKQAEQVATLVGNELGAVSLANLRQLPADAIRYADTGIGDTMPFVDGTVVPAGMRTAFESGKAAKIPLLIGSNDAEAGFFGPGYWQSVPQKLGAQWAKVKKSCFAYGIAGDDPCAEQIASEQFAGVMTRAVARAASKVHSLCLPL